MRMRAQRPFVIREIRSLFSHGTMIILSPVLSDEFIAGFAL
jgi:hypothetical protein